jgi:hypothetical protein
MIVLSMVFPAHHPATNLVTTLPPGTDEMSKHSAPGGDGAVLTGLLVRNPTREWEMIGRPPLNAVPEQ